MTGYCHVWNNAGHFQKYIIVLYLNCYIYLLHVQLIETVEPFMDTAIGSKFYVSKMLDIIMFFYNASILAKAGLCMGTTIGTK